MLYHYGNDWLIDWSIDWLISETYNNKIQYWYYIRINVFFKDGPIDIWLSVTSHQSEKWDHNYKVCLYVKAPVWSTSFWRDFFTITSKILKYL